MFSSMRYFGDDRKITKLANRMHALAPLYLMTHEIKKMIKIPSMCNTHASA